MKQFTSLEKSYGGFSLFTKDIRQIISSIAKASIHVKHLLAMSKIYGDTEGMLNQVNIHGEKVKKMDLLANNIFIQSIHQCKSVNTIISEENDCSLLNNHSPDARYTVAIDPLDGSSNVDVNISVGTIFGIYLNPSNVESVLNGNNLMASGYIMYGTSTTLVITDGVLVNGYTLNPLKNAFVLTQKNIRIPETGTTYSVNEAKVNEFDQATISYLNRCKNNENNSYRYVGSLVADFHRTLVKGGIFLYPGTNSHPDGKLRLLYECNPLAQIVSAAGGDSVSGIEATTHVAAKSIHQRAPLVIGSKTMVEQYKNEPFFTYKIA